MALELIYELMAPFPCNGSSFSPKHPRTKQCQRNTIHFFPLHYCIRLWLWYKRKWQRKSDCNCFLHYCLNSFCVTTAIDFSKFFNVNKQMHKYWMRLMLNSRVYTILVTIWCWPDEWPSLDFATGFPPQHKAYTVHSVYTWSQKRIATPSSIIM